MFKALYNLCYLNKVSVNLLTRNISGFNEVHRFVWSNGFVKVL